MPVQFKVFKKLSKNFKAILKPIRNYEFSGNDLFSEQRDLIIEKQIKLSEYLFDFEKLLIESPDNEDLNRKLTDIENFYRFMKMKKSEIIYYLEAKNVAKIVEKIVSIIGKIDECKNKISKAIQEAPKIDEFISDADPRVLDDYSAYRIIGKSISSSGDTTLKSIQKLIDKTTENIRNRDFETVCISAEGVPFIAVVGPSFMGKSQLSFTLAASQPVIYLNPVSNQSVYQCFRPISDLMYSLLKDDLLRLSLPTNTDYVGVEFLLQDLNGNNRNIPFKSLGFLFALIEKAILYDGFDSDESTSYWFDEYISISYLQYSSLSIVQYYNKFSTFIAYCYFY